MTPGPDDESTHHPVQIVALGGSAGGLQALTRFFEGVPAESGVAYVVILHLSPDRESQLSQILDRRAAIPVVEVTEPVEVEPDRAYVISPHSQLELSGSRLTVKELPEGRPRMPVNRFFCSLAEERGRAAVGIVLSGTGRDGAQGLRAIRERGGITAAQEPEDAEYAEMPRSAISEGRAEVILPAGDLPAEILRIIGEDEGERSETDALPEAAENALDRIVARVGEEAGYDLSRFRRSTLLRRLDRRMSFARIGSLEDYARRIAEDEAERKALFRDLLISVSHFFRDPEVFESLERRVVQELFEGKAKEDQVRVWVPGCATGEEAYSLAILLHEHASRMESAPGVQIFATDIDEDALAFARRAHYPESVVEDLSPARLERYFDRDDAGYQVVRPLRDTILFAVHGILRDPPFSNLDLVSCRNLLIYLEPEAQSEAVERFRYALRPGGHLLLGTSETVSPDLFQPVAKKERIYRRVEGEGSIPLSSTSGGLRPADRREIRTDGEHGLDPKAKSSAADLHGHLLRTRGPPSVVLDDTGAIVHSSDHLGPFLRHPGGEPTRTLLELVREPFVPTLRTALYRALENNESSRKTVVAEIDGESRAVDVLVYPSTSDEGPHVLVLFEERGTVRQPDQADGSDEATTRELQAELKDLQDQLQRTIDERHSTIQELQLANEELQSVNEEHQATAEELETRREELQSVNEELTTINHEHRDTIRELGEVNADLRNLIESTEIATIFLDEDLRLRRYTESATKHFNVLPSDQGRPFSHITHRLDVGEPVLALIRNVIENHETIEREVWDEEGRSCYILGVHPYVSQEERIDGAVLTLFEITERKSVENELRTAKSNAETERRRLLALMDALPAGVVLVDADSRRILSANQRAEKILWKSEDPAGEFHWETVRERHRLPETAEWPVERVIESGEAVLEEEVSVEVPEGARRHLLVNAAPILDEDGTVRECVIAIVDIEEVMRHAREREAERTRAHAMATISTVSHEFRTPVNAILGYTQLLVDGIPEPLPEAQLRTAERIRTCTKHLNLMVEQILAHSQLEEGGQTVVSQEVDPDVLVQEVASILEHQAKDKGLSMRVETEPGMGALVTDPDKLRQVLVNLAQNAVKFTEEGEVVVSVSEGGAEEIVFEVRDTGVGIAPEDQERIFERFGKARRQRPSGVPSTGLGLAIVKDLARLIDGTVELESEPGRGSVFRIRLPRARSPERPLSGSGSGGGSEAL